MYYLFNEIIGINIAHDYQFRETLINTNLYKPTGKNVFDNAPLKLNVEFTPAIADDCREVARGFFCKENIFVDQEYGVRIERISDDSFVIKSQQQCSEWLIILTELLMLMKNYTFIHAAALEKGGECVLIPSWGGVGKTATVVKLIEDYGWKLLGDDLVILDGNNGSVKCHLKNFVIYGYHKNLFPQIFATGKKPMTSGHLSNTLSMAIPIIKKCLRPIPGLLTFARKFNPQSIRVNPKEIFKEEQISNGATLVRQVVWLERTVGSTVERHECSTQSIASRTAAVSLSELFSDRARCVYYLCACGVIDFNEVFERVFRIITTCIKNSDLSMLFIPKELNINNVGDVVAKTLT